MKNPGRLLHAIVEAHEIDLNQSHNGARGPPHRCRNMCTCANVSRSAPSSTHRGKAFENKSVYFEPGQYAKLCTHENVMRYLLPKIALHSVLHMGFQAFRLANQMSCDPLRQKQVSMELDRMRPLGECGRDRTMPCYFCRSSIMAARPRY